MWLQRWVGHLPDGARVIDIAAGRGRNVGPLLARGARVLAVDRDADALAGIDPRAYLTDVLRKLETKHWPWSRLDKLLPPNWTKTTPDSARIPTSR